MNVSLSIRSALVSDHPELSTLFDQLDRLHLEGAPWLLQKQNQDPRPLAYHEALLGNPNTGVLVADVGKCVGLAVVHLREAPPFPVFIPHKRAVIDDLIVHPDWRRRGIGRSLYKACEDWAKVHNAPWIEINVYDFNVEAYNFYSAVGFETTMRRMRKPLGGSR